MGGRSKSKKTAKISEPEKDDDQLQELKTTSGPSPSKIMYRKEMPTIQPLSSDLEASAPPVGQQNPGPAPQQLRPIYPEAQQGIGQHATTTAGYRPPGPRTAPEDTGPNRFINGGIMLLGAIIIVTCGVTLVTWYNALKNAGAFIDGVHLTAISGTVMALAAIFLLLGIGIMQRHESARVLYMYMAPILLIATGYGTYSYIKDQQTLGKVDKSFITSIEREIKEDQNNPLLSGDEKIKRAALAEKEIRIYKSIMSLKRPTLTPLIQGFALSVIPLIILTRARVKDIFE